MPIKAAMLNDTLKAYRRGLNSGTLKSASANVVRELLDEIERHQELLDRIKQHWVGGISEDTEAANSWHGTMRDILDEVG